MSTQDSPPASAQPETLEECRAELTAARQEAAELRDNYLRAAAAIENARKQAERDAAHRANQRLRRFYTRLWEVADNLERALAHAPEENTLRPGVQATLQQLQAALRQEGITPIAVEVGDAFDPQIHEAVTTQEADVDQATVAEILRSGYAVDGEMLRPARVVVTIPARAGT